MPEPNAAGRRLNGVRLLVVALLVATSSCGGGGTEPATSIDDGGGAGSAAGSDLVDHVVVGGRPFEVSCARPDEERLGEARTWDEPDPRFDRVVAVPDEPNVVALEANGRVARCPDARWVLGFAFPTGGQDEATTAEQARIRCVLPAVPDDPRCGEGGPFWYGTDPTEDGTGGDGRSAVWVDARDPEPAWRSDPLEVVARELSWVHDGGDFYRLRRVGLRIIERSPSRVVIEAIHQDVTANADDSTFGSDQREHHTLTPLDGRAGWYEHEFIVATYADRNATFAELDASWPTTVDRVLVDVDTR